MAGKESVAQRVFKIAVPYAEQLGLEIWDVRFVKEGGEWYLRIFIDKEGGISIDDCVNLTHAVTKPLDEADPISQSYTLEVSSPGIERELVSDRHFEKYIGEKIMLRAIRPIDGVRDFAGTLTAYENGEITVSLPDGTGLKINKKETSYVKLDDFNADDFEKEIE